MTILLAVALLFVSACSGEPLSTRENGTLGGGGIGAGTGAIIGAALGAPGAGAAIGGAIGAGMGFVVGNALQNTGNTQHHLQSQVLDATAGDRKPAPADPGPQAELGDRIALTRRQYCGIRHPFPAVSANLPEGAVFFLDSKLFFVAEFC